MWGVRAFAGIDVAKRPGPRAEKHLVTTLSRRRGSYLAGSPLLRAQHPRAQRRELGRLPAATVARPDEVLALISQEKLHGLGLGYVEACLLAATRLSPDTRLWTRDRRLAEVAARLSLPFAAA